MVSPAVDAYQDVLPIFVVRQDRPELTSFEGTGFVIPPFVFLTCWHCVARDLEDGEAYAVGLKQADGGYKLALIENLERDANGSDLALGRLDVSTSIGFDLAAEPALYGTDVWTFGYPLTDRISGDHRKIGFRLNPRFLRIRPESCGKREMA